MIKKLINFSSFEFKEFDAFKKVSNFFLKNYLKKTVLATILSFFVSIFETLGTLTIVPLFLLVTNEQIPTEGITKVIYDFFSKIGISDNLSAVLIFFSLAFIIKALLKFVVFLIQGNTIAEIAEDLRYNLMNSIYSAEWNYFVKQKTGTITNSLGREADQTSRTFSQFILLNNYLILFLIYFLLSVSVSFVVPLAGVIFAFFLVLIVRATHKYYVLVSQRQVQGMKIVIGKLTELILLLKPLKAMYRGLSIKNILMLDVKELSKNIKKQVFFNASIDSLREPMIVIFLCIFLYISLNVLSIKVTEIVFLTFIFYRLITNSINIQNTYYKIIAFSKYMDSFLKTLNTTKKNKEVWDGKLNLGFKSTIVFKDVTFHYKKEKIIKKLSLVFNSKKINALVGPSGCGKTTIVDLILGLYKPISGEILIDRTPLREINIKLWRSQIGYVPQETILLNASVLKNITLGMKYKKNDLDFSLRASGVNEFINKLPQKLNTKIGERGIMLSGGQRQRISIARALLKKPKIMILDEATANLDPLSEKKICYTLKKISKIITIIAISHQKELTNIADKIFSFSKTGNLKEK